MPHLALALAGAAAPTATQKIHYARLVGKRTPAMVAPAISILKEKVQICLAARKARGDRVNPPKEYPDLLHDYVADHYWAPNRGIVYRRSYSADIDMRDCSLIEHEFVTALLQSDQGRCEIDLKKRIAAGVCDPRGHADAPVALPPKGAANGMSIAQMARNPQLAGVAAHLTKVLGSAGATGQKKRIAGLECDVVALPQPGATQCTARGGSFVAGAGEGALPGGGFVLEYLDAKGISTVATQAGYDAAISPAIFVPYQSGAYRITADEP